MSQAPTQEPMAEVLDSQPSAPGWDDLRQRILEALDEDPINESTLVRHLDVRDDPAALPAQRVLATLVGLNSGPAEASRFLEQAMKTRQEWAARRRRPVPLRLVLLDLLLQENRRRPSPLLAELRVSPVPSTSGLADPVNAPTAGSVLVGEVQAELRRARRFEQEAALLRLHLDGWDELLSQAGGAAAERVLAATALLVKNEIRDVDWVARTTNNELVVFLAGTGRFGALLVANRIASKLAHLPVPGAADGEKTRASIGFAAFPEDARYGWELLVTAENAMHRALSEGGDGISDQGLPSPRRLLRVHPDKVRIVVRALPAEQVPAADAHAAEGLVFASPVPYEVGTGLELDCIEVAGSGRAVLAGRVVRLEERVQGGYDIGVTCNLTSEDSALLRGKATRTAR
jgi:diguanylate cyclase (GGDEF)-like protein